MNPSSGETGIKLSVNQKINPHTFTMRHVASETERCMVWIFFVVNVCFKILHAST